MAKIKKWLPITINIILFLVLASAVYAWMVTVASSGELVTYHRHLTVSNVNLEVKLYKMVNEQYYEVDDDVITLDYLQPNEYRYFKFKVKNNGESSSTARIILEGFTGNMSSLGDKVYFGVVGTNEPMKKLSENLEVNHSTGYNYITLTDKIIVNGESTQDIEWYIYIDKDASNEIANKSIDINSINFIKP